MEHGLAMDGACPLSAQKMSASAARVNGVITLVLLVLALLTPAHWILAILAADFAIKALTRFRYSPISAISRVISTMLRLPERTIDAAPKRFTAGLCLVFAITGLVLGPLLAQWPAYYIVVSGFAACATLDVLTGICVGCKLYQVVTPTLYHARRVLKTSGP